MIEVLGIKDPLYVDIGVCHPVVRNNTYLLYEKGYTNGILIEPNGNMCELAQIYRPKNKIVEAGASGDEGGILRYYMKSSVQLERFIIHLTRRLQNEKDLQTIIRMFR